MRFSMLRSLFAIVVLVVLGPAGCLQEGAAPQQDGTGPLVRLYYPPNIVDHEFAVSDSADVFAGVSGLPKTVEMHALADGAALPDTIKRIVQITVRPDHTIDPAQVPKDSLRFALERLLPTGWFLYRGRLITTKIPSGRYLQLFAIATNPAGNKGRSEPVRVRVLNQGEDLTPPTADFAIFPPEGTIKDTIVFDPGLTTDRLDTLKTQLSVRWDFNGDQVWDIDWSPTVTAAKKQVWIFEIPRVYIVTMEARNSYLPQISTKSRPYRVNPQGGVPRPPEPNNYVEIPIGTYVMGDTISSDESPVHNVAFSQSYRIEKTEVTNRLYAAYLGAALDSARIRVSRDYTTVYRRDFTADSTQVYVVFSNTKLSFDGGRFQVQAGYEDHPVTGVTWYGAQEYAFFYGLRLPTEGEWEVAARGDSASFHYPHGRTIGTGADSLGMHRVNYSRSGDPYETPGNQIATTPVGYYNGEDHDGFQTIDAPSVWGLNDPNKRIYDMAGNVAEWVSDWYGAYRAGTENDPSGPTLGRYKVIRGGSYQSSALGVRCTARQGSEELNRSMPAVGFRTAYYPVF